MLHPAAGFGMQTRCIFEIISLWSYVAPATVLAFKARVQVFKFAGLPITALKLPLKFARQRHNFYLRLRTILGEGDDSLQISLAVTHSGFPLPAAAAENFADFGFVRSFEPAAMLAAFFNKAAAGGLLVTNVNDSSLSDWSDLSPRPKTENIDARDKGSADFCLERQKKMWAHFAARNWCSSCARALFCQATTTSKKEWAAGTGSLVCLVVTNSSLQMRRNKCSTEWVLSTANS